MENIYEIAKQIESVLNSSQPLKTDLHNYLTQMNNEIISLIGDLTIDNSKFDYLFVKTNQERIQELDVKLSKVNSGPEILSEAVLYGQEKMRKFLRKYNIGFLKSLVLNDSGNFNIEIGCLIHKKDSFSKNVFSEQKIFETQMQTLKELGVELENSKLSNGKAPCILGNDNSINALNKLIKSIDGVGIKYELSNYKDQISIRSIKFKTTPMALFNFNESIDEFTIAKTNIINENEKINIFYELKQVLTTLSSFFNPDLKEANEACRSIILHSFASLCEACEYDTVISNIIKEAYAKSKEEQILIKQKEKMLKEKINPSLIKDFTSNITKQIEKNLYENLNFNLLECNIDQSIKIGLRFNTSGDCFYVHNDDLEMLSIEDIKSMFDCIGDFNDECLLKNTPANIDMLNKKLNDIFGQAYISKIETDYKKYDNCYYISKIEVSIDNFNFI